MKRALILGVSGQDGAYLAQFLARKGYEVHGTSRDTAQRFDRLRALGVDVEVHALADLRALLAELQPDEIYNLSGLSSVAQSFREPELARASILDAQVALLESVRELAPRARVYQSASSECFGDIERGSSANEETPFAPRSPYAEAKAAAHRATIEFRERYGLYACSGIVFNHESPLRGEAFVTAKIIRAAADIARRGGQSGLPVLHLGDLSASRDWGYAPEYVEAFWLMLQQREPDDFVIATGESHSVEELVAAVFAEYGLDHRQHVVSDPAFMRRAELHYSRGDATRAARVLGWQARTRFAELVRMLSHDGGPPAAGASGPGPR